MAFSIAEAVQRFHPRVDVRIRPTTENGAPVLAGAPRAVGHRVSHSDGVSRFLELLHLPGSVVEIRVKYRKRFKNKKDKWVETQPAFGKLFTNHEEAAEYAVEQSDKENTVAVWTTLNCIDPNIQWPEDQKGTRDVDIVRRTAILVDFDNQRPKNTNATDEEREESERRARECQEWLSEQGFPQPLFCDSGNGHHLIYKVDLPIDDGGLVERFLKVLDNRFSTDKVKVDTGVHDLARVCKVPGTFARKGPDTPERPHRTAEIIEAPDWLEPVPSELLEKIIGEPVLTKAKAKPEAEVAERPETYEPTKVDIRTLRVEAVLDYLREVGIEPTERKNKSNLVALNIPYCPFKGEDHTEGHTGILVFNDGEIAVKCFHDKCAGGTWEEMQKKLGLKFSKVVNETAMQAIFGTTSRYFYDPLLLAQKHNRKYFTEDGTPTLVCFGDETYSYS